MIQYRTVGFSMIDNALIEQVLSNKARKQKSIIAHLIIVPIVKF